jgi:hypothetical protein
MDSMVATTSLDRPATAALDGTAHPAAPSVSVAGAGQFETVTS